MIMRNPSLTLGYRCPKINCTRCAEGKDNAPEENRLLEDLGTDDVRSIQEGGFNFAMHARLLASDADTYDGD